MDVNGELLECRHLANRKEYKHKWGYQFGNEVGRLAQGMPGRVQGTNTMFFITKKQIPEDQRQDSTYRHIVCDVLSHKENSNRVRITVGGAQLITHGNVPP